MFFLGGNQRIYYCAHPAGNGIPAEVFIVFAGTECAVCGDQDSFFFHALRLLSFP